MPQRLVGAGCHTGQSPLDGYRSVATAYEPGSLEIWKQLEPDHIAERISTGRIAQSRAGCGAMGRNRCSGSTEPYHSGCYITNEVVE